MYLLKPPHSMEQYPGNANNYWIVRQFPADIARGYLKAARFRSICCMFSIYTLEDQGGELERGGWAASADRPLPCPASTGLANKQVGLTVAAVF